MELDKDLNLTVVQKTRILEKIRTDLQGRNSFKMFLSKEFAEENLLFVEAVEKFEDAPQDERYDLGFKIYDTFVKQGSPKEVNMDAKVRKALAAGFTASEIKKHMFRDANEQVLETLRDDNLMRYMKSSAYEKFIEKIKEEREINMKGTKVGSATPKAKHSSPATSPSGSSPLSRQETDGKSDGDILDLMFQVYEDVKEMNVAEALQEQEETHLGGVTDFEMFLLQGGGQSPSSKTQEKKEKKEGKPKDKKPGLWARITDEQKRKKGSDSSKKSSSEKPGKKKPQEQDEFSSYL